MDTTFVEQAIPMVSVDQNTGKYVLTQQAIKFLKGIHGPIAVVSVAGLYRTGKSYLLNRVLLNRANGFGVGSTVNACTKGLWCWGTPIKGTSLDGEQVSIIVIDTEGIGALDEDQTHDTKIFTLAILASSVFIYNSVGSIDQNAVQNLSLVVNLTKHIQLKASGKDQDGQDPDQISSYFPTFYWVVRDFSLQLQDPQGNPISSKEYLEKALAPQNGFSDDVEQKNRIRRLLTAFFKDRDCITMIRPLVDQQKLQNLDKMQFNQLRPQFMQQALNFRKRIINSVKGKSLQNQKLNGDMYCSMVNSYVNAINQGAVPNIENAWNYMCEEQCRKALDDCYEFFIKQIKDNFKQFPKPEEEFQKVVSEAEEKTVEFFREKALGEKSVMFLKELKNRMRNTIAQSREQNIKESNEIIRNFILKNVTFMKAKLNNQEYKSYPQFEKQLNLTFERIVKDGPKLHSHKVVYTEAMRKFSAQGAQFLFRNFTKSQQKERQITKMKEKELQTQLQQATEQRQALRKQLMDYTVSNDQIIVDLNYKIQTLTAQLKMTEHSKMEEQKKMQRQLYAKHSELENNRRALETKIKDMMQKLEESTKLHNNDKRQWEKEKAIFELKVKQQSTQIDELTKKEKLLDANLNVSKNQSVNQVRTITQRYENEAIQLKNKLKQFEEKNNQMTEQLNSLKQEIQSKNQKFQKKEKKYKQEVSNRNKQIEKLNRELETQRKKMNQQLQKNTQNSNQQFKVLQQKLKQSEKLIKNNQDQFRKMKNEFEKDYQMLKEKHEMMVSKYEQEKLKHTELKQKHQSFITKLEQSFKQKSQEAAVMKMNQVKQQYETITNNMKSEFEKQRNNFIQENSVLAKRIEEIQKQNQVLRIQNHKKDLEHKEYIQQAQENINYWKNWKKTLEGQKENDINELQNRHMFEVENLKRQIEEVKEMSRMQLDSANKNSTQVIQSLRAAFELEKQQMNNRLRNQKQKNNIKVQKLNQEYDNKIKELEQNLESQIQQLQQKLVNTQELLRSQSSQLQHEIDINVKKAEALEKSNMELKETLEKKENIFNNKYEQIYQQSKLQRQKLEEKIEFLINENNKKDKDLMNTIHARDNYMSSLEKKEARLTELQRESHQQKESLKNQIELLHNKISALDAQTHNKATGYEKAIALANQENNFLKDSMKDLSRDLQSQKQTYERQISKLKEQLDNQKKNVTQRLTKENKQLDTKYKELKKIVKQNEVVFKKSYEELKKQKEMLEMTAASLEAIKSQLIEKSTYQMNTLTVELSKMKEENQSLKSTLYKQTDSFKNKINQLENVIFEKTAQFQKEKSLGAQKILFLSEQREQTKKEAEQKIKTLENQLILIREKLSSEKSQMGSMFLTTYKDNQAKLNSKVSELSNLLTNKTYQYDRILREKENEIKIIREQLESQKFTRQSLMSKSEKKNGEYQEKLRRLKQEFDKYKSEKERKQTEMLKAQNTEKEQSKSKINSLETIVKQAQQKRMAYYFESEQLKTKLQMEKDHISDQMANYQQLAKKYEKQNGKFKIQIQKLKAQRKNVKTHSFIGNLKTTYIEPTKVYVEEFNKQNVGQQ